MNRAKKTIGILLVVVCLASLFGCAGDVVTSTPSAEAPPNNGASAAEASACETSAFSAGFDGTENMVEITLQIDGLGFVASLYDNEATRALRAYFPLEIEMNDLNENEKFYYLPDTLPASAERVGTIQAGDLMLYGSDCLVLFYKTFTTPYQYTRLGTIEEAGQLPDAVGNGNVRVVFSEHV